MSLAHPRTSFHELARELADWRLGEYLKRPTEPPAAERFRGRVRHAGGRPIIFLPDRNRVPGPPEGWTPLRIDGEAYEGNFAKVALNVVRRDDGEENVLHEVLRGWFGADAGLPGTRFEVLFERDGEGGF